MNIENQVCSLGLSKRLKELGVEQKSLFYWADGSIIISIDIQLLTNDDKARDFSGVNNCWPDEDIFELYSALTTTELGEMLPGEIYKEWINDYGITGKSHYTLFMGKLSDGNYFYYYDDGTGEQLAIAEDKNEANARAKLLIYLIENKLIEIR